MLLIHYINIEKKYFNLKKDKFSRIKIYYILFNLIKNFMQVLDISTILNQLNYY